jgi:hypothetical protein
LSIALPIRGPIKPDTKREKVNAQKKVSVEIPIDAAIGTARTAGI